MSEFEHLALVAKTVYFFMTGAYDLTGVSRDLPAIDSPYSKMVTNDLTMEDGIAFKDFEAMYSAKDRITEELNCVESREECEYDEIENLLSQIEGLMEETSTAAFIHGYQATKGIGDKKELASPYEHFLKIRAVTLGRNKEISFDKLCECFEALQERLWQNRAKGKESPDIHLIKVSHDAILRGLIDKAYAYGISAGNGTLPLWYEEF